MGLATSKAVGRDHYVVLADVSQARLDQAVQELDDLGIESESVMCDVTDRRSVEQLAARATSAGTVMSVVHAAGLSPQMGEADLIVRVNALGTVHITEAFLRSAGAGFSLVNVASAAGHLPTAFPIPRRTYQLALTDPDRFASRLARRCHLVPRKLRPGIAYSISKNFVIWYSQRQAAAFGLRGARVVSVSPGSFDTKMGRLEEVSGAGALAEHAALRRFGRVEEIAEVLAFCASAKPGYLTGTDVLVDGGAGATMTTKDLLAIARNPSNGHPGIRVGLRPRGAVRREGG